MGARAVRLAAVENFESLSEAERPTVLDALWEAHRADFPKTPDEQTQKVRREADRMHALAHLAEPYGCPVHIYNHNGWFGMIENELAIERLEELGAPRVGLVYNFTHARDGLHDDSTNFPELREKIKPHVAVVNITGMAMDGYPVVYPSQGDGELVTGANKGIGRALSVELVRAGAEVYGTGRDAADLAETERLRRPFGAFRPHVADVRSEAEPWRWPR